MVTPLLPWREPEVLRAPGALRLLPQRIREDQLDTVLVVTDAGIVNAGLVTPLLQGLAEVGISSHVYDGTLPNPTAEQVEEALSVYLNNRCQGVVAIGGGSPMDCSKGVAVRLAHLRRPLAKSAGVLRVLRRLVPLYAIPTTAGTGSECTLAAVISDEATHRKYAIMDTPLIPTVAVLDPELTLSLPPHITAATGMDALTHGIEAYIGRSNTAATRRDAVEAVTLIMKHLPQAYHHGSDMTARRAMLAASYLAGRAFTRAYVGNVHAIAHTFGGFAGVPHGLANAVILPHVLEWYGGAVLPQLDRLAQEAGVAPDGIELISAIRALNQDMNIPTYLDPPPENHLPHMVEQAFREANPLYPVPRVCSRDDFFDLFRRVTNTRDQGDA